MISYLTTIIITGIIIIFFTFLFSIFFIVKKRKEWSRQLTILSIVLISIETIYCFFILLLPWPYLIERNRGLENIKEYHFKRASLHFNKALEYKKKMGILPSIFKNIMFIKNEYWHMDDDLNSLILKCAKFQSECVEQPERFKMCHPKD